jgi:hypothetical protein
MPRRPGIRLTLVLPVLLGALLPLHLVAQDAPPTAPNYDPDEAPLGDVARTFRRKTPPSEAVIDDDNLTKVMEQAESRHTPGSALRFLMAGEGKGFRVSAPDVTCSLAFTANVKSLLSNQFAQMELPAGEVLKLEGPATIEGDALIVAIFNRTDWHVSEVAVALTVVKKPGARDALTPDGITPIDGTPYVPSKFLPAVEGNQESEVRPEKQPDVTVIYRMRATAPPSATTVFSAPLNLKLAPDEEWHWAIVQARGYPPQSYAGNTPQPAPQASTLAPAQSMPIQPPLPSSPATPETSPAGSLSQNPQ